MANSPVLSSELFKTSDSALAAWLYSNGFQIHEVDDSKFPSVIFFEHPNKEFHDLVRQWQRGEAQGNCCVFFTSYKTVIGRVKNGR